MSGAGIAAPAGAGPGAGGPRPAIGISAYCEQARWGRWDLPAVLLPRNYCDQVSAAGGIAVLLPPDAGSAEFVKRLDGLIISGGPDVDPANYGEEPGPHTSVLRPERDAAELALIRAALALRLPVLGVCRGMQLMNVALGGTLLQHLPDAVGNDQHLPEPGGFGTHAITIAPDCRLAALRTADQAAAPLVTVPTHHHQGIGRLAAGLTELAWADDGTIEAVELDQAQYPFAIGVQWHPEAGRDPGLFQALVAAARVAMSAPSVRAVPAAQA